MSRLKDFQEKLKKKTKFELIKSLFQAFSVTVVAVVAVVVFIPRSPKANFDDIKVFSHEIIYQVSVTDEDNAIEGNPIKIILENQFGREEQVISLGQNLGSFTSLSPLTEYKLKVVYDKGFGEETLAIETITTNTDLIAAITNFTEFIDPFVQEPYISFYDVGITYGITDGYSDWQLRYATIYPESQDIFYSVYQLLNQETEAQVEFYNSTGATYHLILEAMFEGQMTVIDEVTIKAPFSIGGIMYLSYYNDTEVAFDIYDAYHHESVAEVNYVIELYQGSKLVTTVSYIPKETSTSEQSSTN